MQLSDSTTTVQDLKSIVQQFVAERSWEAFHSPKNLSMSISIEAAELMEHFQWSDPSAPSTPIAHDSPVAQELSDVIAYALSLANVLGLDVSRALESKMERNKLKYPVGGKFIPKTISSPE